jgi:hypothetical protein
LLYDLEKNKKYLECDPGVHFLKGPFKNFKIKIPPILSKPLDTERVEGRDEEGRIIGEFDNLNQAVLLKSVLKHNNLSVLPIGKKFRAPSIVSCGRDSNKYITTLWKEESGLIYFYSERVTKYNRKIK